MIEISAIIPWSLEERPTYAAPVIRELHVVSPNPRRLAGFYARAFGFYAVGGYGRDGGAPIVLPATQWSDLIVHEGARARPGLLDRWAFVVADLDQVREAIWELGISAARDSGDPDHIFRRSHGRSLYVRDPDSHEIELVEIWTQAQRRASREAQACAA
jgi:hypothetical protein